MRCASCEYLTFDVVRGDRCSLTGRSVSNGKYCKNYEMRGNTKEEAISSNDYLRKKTIQDNKVSRRR